MGAITKKQAIRECKELWREIRDYRQGKRAFLYSPEGKKWKNKNYAGNCPLCEYTYCVNPSHWMYSCRECPLVLQFGMTCNSLRYVSLPAEFAEYVMKLRED